MARPFELAGRSAIVVTMHGKEQALEPALGRLGLRFLPAPSLDTDLFGTFTRDVARAGSQREALLAKARAGLQVAPGADFAVASEGAFGPHPQIPFVSSGLELVALFERKSGRAVIGYDLTTATNFAQSEARNLDAVGRFADQIGLPDHAAVVMASSEGPLVAKGVTARDRLLETCASVLEAGGSVWLEADMRAHMNPTRMAAIARAADNLAQRLESRCPTCDFPDWTLRILSGRPCGWCGEPTDEPWIEVRSCEACGKSAEVVIEHMRKAVPGACRACNP